MNLMENNFQNLKKSYQKLIEKIEPISKEIKKLLNDEKYLDTNFITRF